MPALTRRRVLWGAGGVFALGALLPGLVRASAAAKVVEIRMRGNEDGSKVWFEPSGLLIQPGQTVRWISDDPNNSHTTTAYHPRNDSHSLRIPEGAQPWNSDYLLPGETFDQHFVTEGVYDYYCIPHEEAGMVGRIIVGRPLGPGTLPFDYFLGLSPAPDWLPVPEAARKTFPPVAAILEKAGQPG